MFANRLLFYILISVAITLDYGLSEEDISGRSVLKDMEERYTSKQKSEFDGSNGPDLASVDKIHKHRKELNQLHREHAELRSSDRHEEADAVQERIEQKMKEMNEVTRASHEKLNKIGSEGSKRDIRSHPGHDEIMELQKRYGELRREGNHEEAELVHTTIRDKLKKMHMGSRDGDRPRRRPPVVDEDEDEDRDFKKRGRGRAFDSQEDIEREFGKGPRGAGGSRSIDSQEDLEREFGAGARGRRSGPDEDVLRSRGRPRGRKFEDDEDDPHGIRNHRAEAHRRRESIEKEIHERHMEMTKHRVDELSRRAEKAGFTEEEMKEVASQISEYEKLEMELLQKRFEDRKSLEALHESGDHESAMERIRAHRDSQRESERELRDQVRLKRRDVESRIRDKIYDMQHEL